MSSSAKRFRSLAITLAMVAGTNLAISGLVEKSGVAVIPNSPRPKSGVAVIPNSPRPKVVNFGQELSHQARSGVAVIPNSPRP